jgi:hypothetical protein
MSTDETSLWTEKRLGAIKSLLRQGLSTRGISARKASKDAGFNVGYLGDVLDGRSKSPEVGRILALAETLEIPKMQVLHLIDDGAVEYRVPWSDPALRGAPMPGAESRIPLYASRFVTEGPWADLPEESSQSVDRLPRQAREMDAYAVRVFNKSCEPRYRPGEVIYVSPLEAIRAGDFVFLRAPKGAAIARVVQYGPIILETIDGTRLDVDQSELEFLHRIVGSTE